MLALTLYPFVFYNRLASPSLDANELEMKSVENYSVRPCY